MSKYSHNSPVLHRFYKNLCTNIVFKHWYFHQKLGEKPPKKRVISMEYQPFIRNVAILDNFKTWSFLINYILRFVNLQNLRYTTFQIYF